MSKPFKHDPQWAKAKVQCRLNQEDIEKAKALGFSPKALMKNNPSPSQKWKKPVKFWIRELFEQKFPQRRKPAIEPTPETAPDDSDPF